MAITAAGTDTRIKAVATLSMYDMSRDMSKGHMDYYTMECGLCLWDTAAVYGEGSSERIFGNFVKEVSRKDVILSTKFTPQIASASLDAMQEMIDGSKECLHTNIIDIYWIHNPMDVEKWTPDLIPLAKSGRI